MCVCVCLCVRLCVCVRECVLVLCITDRFWREWPPDVCYQQGCLHPDLLPRDTPCRRRMHTTPRGIASSASMSTQVHMLIQKRFEDEDQLFQIMQRGEARSRPVGSEEPVG